MKHTALLLALFTVSCASERPAASVKPQPSPQTGTNTAPLRTEDWPDARLTQQIADILKDCQRLQPGMTRAQLLRYFTIEGGISDARHRTYTHRACSLIKVDVDFKLADPNPAAYEESPADVITKISQPYLAWMVFD